MYVLIKIQLNGVKGKSSLIKYASPSLFQLTTKVIISTPDAVAVFTASLYSGSIIDG